MLYFIIKQSKNIIKYLNFTYIRENVSNNPNPTDCIVLFHMAFPFLTFSIWHLHFLCFFHCFRQVPWVCPMPLLRKNSFFSFLCMEKLSSFLTCLPSLWVSFTTHRKHFTSGHQTCASFFPQQAILWHQLHVLQFLNSDTVYLEIASDTAG